MTRHYPDLGSGSGWSCLVGNLIQPIRSTPHFWLVKRFQYGISALVSQTSFGGETSGNVAKCRLFSLAKQYRVCPTFVELNLARHTMRRLNQMSRQCRSVIQLGLEHEKYSVWTRPNCLTASNLRKRRSIILNDEYMLCENAGNRT